jgi:hypothetical protein
MFTHSNSVTMKNVIKYLSYALVLSVIVILSSCEKQKNEPTGTAEFLIGIQDESFQAKSASSPDSGVISWQLLISISDLAGNPVVSDKMIPLYSFGAGYISEKLELKSGEFKLTKFMMINSSGTVVYAAPAFGSPLAYLTKNPLPFKFNILLGQQTQVTPEVLAVGDQTSDKFGYANFGVLMVKPLRFFTTCVLDPGNPLIMAPIQITDAKLTVHAPDGWHYSFKVEPKVNQFIIRGGFESYTFVVEKEGFLPVKIVVTARELNASTQENPLMLKIAWNSSYKTLTLQPGPDAGKDAMISNLEPDKNFGAHKYFEATFLSEPVLTVMRSNRSLIWFNTNDLPKSAIIKRVILTLRYDLPIPWDLNAFPVATPGSNLWYGAVLQQIIEPWEEGNVNWNNQPKTTEANQVFVSPFIKNANGIEIDVTRLYVNPSANVLPNYGMMFRLFPTDKFPGFRFASSDFAEPLMRPRLSIAYSL